jgi:hypothetical protein
MSIRVAAPWAMAAMGHVPAAVPASSSAVSNRWPRGLAVKVEKPISDPRLATAKSRLLKITCNS